jgi:hypothetical protein
MTTAETVSSPASTVGLPCRASSVPLTTEMPHRNGIFIRSQTLAPPGGNAENENAENENSSTHTHTSPDNRHLTSEVSSNVRSQPAPPENRPNNGSRPPQPSTQSTNTAPVKKPKSVLRVARDTTETITSIEFQYTRKPLDPIYSMFPIPFKQIYPPSVRNVTFRVHAAIAMLSGEVINETTHEPFSSNDSANICDILLRGLSPEQIQAASLRRYNDTVEEMNYLRHGRHKLDLFRGVIRERRVSGLPTPRKRVIDDDDDSGGPVVKRATQRGRSQSPLSVRFRESDGLRRAGSMSTETSSPDSSNIGASLLGGISHCYEPS